METRFQTPTTAFKDANVLTIEVRHGKGGVNYFTGRNEGRGVYVHVTPVEVKDGMRSFMLFGEFVFKILVKPTARKSQKAIEQVAAALKPHISDLVAIAERKDEREFAEKVFELTAHLR